MRKEAEIRRVISMIDREIAREKGQPDCWLLLRRGLRFALGEIGARGIFSDGPTQEEADYVRSIPHISKTRRK